MTCTQAQDLPAALAAVALRSAPRTVAAVDAALDAGEVVRSWPMRGTLHLVAAEDLRWMLTLGPPRVANAAAKRRADLDITDRDLGRAAEATVAVLSGGRRIRRDALMQVWRDAGVRTDGARAVHLFGKLAVDALICLGPLTGRRQDVVLVDDWVPATRAPDRDEAVASWVLRYFRSHGPATVHDFAWWTGLTLADARAGLSAVSGSLERVSADGTDHWMDPATPGLLAGCRREARGVHLLPGFDEMVLGYRDRSAVVPPAFAQHVMPGGGGMFLATVVSGGRAVATWRRPTSRAATTPEVAPFTTLTKAVASAVPRKWATYPRPA
ncbi:MAG: hypothetical protein QOJ60_3339 [Actinomycetota bacterium]|jgi:hypothetical protein|nr:hypothetical protein [Actinomycetota bacterium]